MGASSVTTVDPARPLVVAGDTPSATRFLAIYGIGRQLLEQKEPALVLRTIHEAIVGHLKPDCACLLAVSSDGAYRPVTFHNLDLSRPQEAWQLSRTVLSKARDEALAVLAQNVQTDPRFENAKSVKRQRIRSVMCVPLGRDPVRGLLYLDNRVDRPFSKEDLDFLTAVSLYASLVLERTEEYQRASEALQRSDERLALLEGELLRHQIVGRSPKLIAAYDAVRRFASAGARVLLRGETGTGKELFARAYASNTTRVGRPYVPVPIPALAPTLIESELFGHVRGAFTEASRDRKGRLELADGGVLFLDEVGDIEVGLQPKLLRFLDSGELHRVGDNEPRRVDALVVSATNRPLEKDVESGKLRPDLLARLGHPVVLPPLRERPEDIPLLVEHFLAAYDRGTPRKVFSPGALELLRRHPWPFNVRELQQLVERSVCLVDREVVEPEDLPEYLTSDAARARGSELPGDAFQPLRALLDFTEKAHIVRALQLSKGNKRRAIELLQVSSETFYRKLDDYGLKKKEA